MSEERDPVCGMKVDTASPYVATHDGKTYYFCSETCRDRFETQPSQYLSAAAGDEDVLFDPPYTVTHGFAAPKFGSAGSGGAEYEQIRKDDLDKIREAEG